MAGTNSRFTRVMINEIDLSTQSTAANTNITAETEDVTTFQLAGKATLTLDPEIVQDISGYYVDATAGMEKQIYDALSAPADVAMHYGTDDGGIVYLSENVSTANMSVTAPVPGVIAVAGGWLPAAPKRGLVLGWGTFAATGAQAAINVGTGDVELIVNWHDVGGGTDVTVSVETSDNGTTGWANVTTQTASAPEIDKAEIFTADGFFRMVVDDLGGGTGPTVTVYAVPL